MKKFCYTFILFAVCALFTHTETVFADPPWATNWLVPKAKTTITDSDTYHFKSKVFMDNLYVGGKDGINNGYIVLNGFPIGNWTNLYPYVIQQTGFESNLNQSLTSLSNSIIRIENEILIRQVTTNANTTNINWLIY